MSKTEAKKEVEKFFKELKNKTPKQVKKIKRLAMQFNISLKKKKRLFCKECYSVYQTPKIRIKNKVKILECEICKKISRWKL